MPPPPLPATYANTNDWGNAWETPQSQPITSTSVPDTGFKSQSSVSICMNL